MKRVIAVDWSGAKTGARRKMWLAEVCGGRLQRLESGRDRCELIEHLFAAEIRRKHGRAMDARPLRTDRALVRGG